MFRHERCYKRPAIFQSIKGINKMPTDQKTNKKKPTKKESGKKEEELIEGIQPTKFILIISKCGTDLDSSIHGNFEHDNPVIIGLKGIDKICEGLATKESQPFLKYLLACGLLRGLPFIKSKKFDKGRIFSDMDNLADIIKNLSLKELKGGSEDGRPENDNPGS